MESCWGRNEPFMHEMVFAVRNAMEGGLSGTGGDSGAGQQGSSCGRSSSLRACSKSARGSSTQRLSDLTGKKAFSLYETFGMPLDFMVDAARDAGVEFDMEGFEAAKIEEQERARASWKGGSQKSAAPVYRELAKTEFEGYTALRVDGARVTGAGERRRWRCRRLQPGEEGEVVLDATSFYADSGGQVGDVGWLYGRDHQTSWLR